MFQENDPDTGQVFVDLFCQFRVDNKVVLGRDSDTDARAGVCCNFARRCTVYQNHVCVSWKTAPGQYGHAATFGMTWNTNWCLNQKKSCTVDLDTCKKRFTEDVLGRCRVDRDNEGAKQPYLNIGGTFYGDQECVAWTLVALRDPPPDAWFEPPS